MIEHDYSLSVHTAAAADPVSLVEQKTHMRVDHADEDALITSLITAATKHLETVMDRAFVTQTLRASLPCWPSTCRYGPESPAYGEILLPRAPLQSVTSITYVDSGGTSQTWGTSNYQVDAQHLPGRIVPAFGATFPTLRTETINPVSIVYVAGYGLAAAVPEPIKAAIKLLAAHWYENREPVVVGNIVTPLPMAVESLLWSYRSF
jgi:uncharacterized phiE125 gp8 family phage protein